VKSTFSPSANTYPSSNKADNRYETAQRNNIPVTQSTARDDNLDLVINNAIAISAHPPSGYRP
jgi:hypothetical protein